MGWLGEGRGTIALKVVMAVGIIVLSVAAWRALKKALSGSKVDEQEPKVGLTIFENILRVVIWAWAACAIADVCFGIDMAGVIGALGIVGIAVSLGAQSSRSWCRWTNRPLRSSTTCLPPRGAARARM